MKIFYKITQFAVMGVCLNSVVFSNEAPKDLPQGTAMAALIKADKALMRFDERLRETFTDTRVLLENTKQEALDKEQEAWWSHVNEIRDATRLKDAYEKRIEALEAVQVEAFSILFNANETIDFKSEELLGFLKRCPYDVCRVYASFIAFENGDKTEADIKQAVDSIHAAEKDEARLREDRDPYLPFERAELPSASEITDYYLTKLTLERTYDLPSHLLQEAGIPAWLALKYPEIFDASWDRTSQNNFLTSWRFDDFNETLNELESGRWVTTSYCTWQGSIHIDMSLGQRVCMAEVLLAPQRILSAPGSPQERLEALDMWSFKGIWNRMTFLDFKKGYARAVMDLQDYYQSHDPLATFAPRADEILSWYAQQRFPHKEFDADERLAYEIVRVTTGKVDDLKVHTKALTQKGWDALLHMAILGDLTLEAITWIIDAGANVNAPFYDETCLMNAVKRPDVVRLLLDRGANVKGATLYGKTALFYAVQYGSQESVEMLLGAGAQPNDSILTQASLAKLYEDELAKDTFTYDALPEKVADFTALVYALRYADKPTQDLLLSHGATLGSAPRERIKEWVMEAGAIEEEALDARLKEMGQGASKATDA
ncbi:MAG: hypothetical protein C0514_02055 [Candidatus Puniceispirillum sp.]|nr:hypothetical protein [Candidatus Puniceispirillum sp.]